MKKAIIGIILYFLTIHVVLPALFYWYKGGVFPIYNTFLDMPAYTKAGLLIFISFSISLLVLLFLPKGKTIVPKLNTTAITSLFYFSVLFKLFTFYLYGGYSGLLAGDGAGKINTYIAIFLNPFTLLLILFFGQSKKSSLIKPIIFYIISVTLSGSRSGILSVFFVFFIGLAFDSFSFYKNKIIKFLKYSLILSPMLYVFATQTRNGSTVDYSFLQYAIVGRMSTIETAMYPVYYKDNNLDMNLFNEKYSVVNQFKLILDAFLPGQFFDFDISPNNYYRAMFMDASLNYVRENYMSINMTLPVYLYVKYGYFCVFLTVIYIIGFYRLINYLKENPLIVIALLSCFYSMIYYFDWLMTFTELYSALLTVCTVKLYMFLRKLFLPYFKNHLHSNKIETTTLE